MMAFENEFDNNLPKSNTAFSDDGQALCHNIFQVMEAKFRRQHFCIKGVIWTKPHRVKKWTEFKNL